MSGTQTRASASAVTGIRRIGCVSFLNSKPLIEGLEASTNPAVHFDVPSALLADLESGQVDIALCPVIDFQRSRVELEIVPVGGIGCQGITLTVRLYSQIEPSRITEVYADTHSHTSVALLQVLLWRKFKLRPKLIDYTAPLHPAYDQPSQRPVSMLLIGDKTVANSPPAVLYPHQMDLGQAWNELTGLPFVFATWMARAGADLGDLPAILEKNRLLNAGRIDAIVARHAQAHGWPDDLAKRYLGQWLQYQIGPRQLAAMQQFWREAADLGLVPRLRPLRVRDLGPGTLDTGLST